MFSDTSYESGKSKIYNLLLQPSHQHCNWYTVVAAIVCNMSSEVYGVPKQEE